MTLQGKRVLVFGGGGFIGSHVVDALQAQGARVVVLDLYKPDGVSETIDWIAGSLADPQIVQIAARGCDAAIYLAGHSLPASGNNDVAAEVTNHVAGTIKSAEICAAEGVGRFIFSSSGGTVYGSDTAANLLEDDPTHPKTAYGVSKLAIEHYLRVVEAHRGIKTISLRVANPYGVGQRAGRGQGFIAAAMAAAFSGSELSIWGDGKVVRDFVYVGDVAAAFVTACTYAGPLDLFNIGKGEGSTLLEIIARVEEASGRPLAVTMYPERAIDVQRNVLDIARARSHLGWSPSLSLREGLARTAAWWAAQA